MGERKPDSPDARTAAILVVASGALLLQHFEGSPAACAARFGLAAGTALPAMFSFVGGFLLLGVFPAAGAKAAFDIDPGEFGLRIGDARAGRRLLAWAMPLAALLAWLASYDPAFQATYPLGRPAWDAPGGVAGYLGAYALYYLGYEFLFRGLLLFGLRERFGDAGANLVQTALSAVFHLGRPEAEAFASLAAGPVFGWAALRTNSFLYGFLAHLVLGAGLDLFLLARGAA